MKGRFETLVSVILFHPTKKRMMYTVRMRKEARNDLAHYEERHFPGGSVRAGESLETAAQRVIFDSLGIHIQLREAFGLTKRSAPLDVVGGERIVATYWYLADIRDGVNPELVQVIDAPLSSSLIPGSGQWGSLEQLVNIGTPDGLGETAFARLEIFKELSLYLRSLA